MFTNHIIQNYNCLSVCFLFLFDRSLLRSAVSLSASTCALFRGTLFLLVTRSREGASLDSLGLGRISWVNFVWWCLRGELAWLVGQRARLVGRARLQVTAIILILYSLHVQIYCATTRLNFRCFLFELSSTAAQITLVLHPFARFFFVCVPVC